MIFFETLTPWHWLILTAVLLIAEVSISSSGFLLWMGLGAGVMSFIIWIAPTLFWGAQLILFSVISILTSVLWWAYLKKYPIKTQDPKLNRRSEQYIGRTFILIEAIQNGRGKIRVDDSIWTVKGPDLPVGALVEIIQVEGLLLIGKKAGERLS